MNCIPTSPGPTAVVASAQDLVFRAAAGSARRDTRRSTSSASIMRGSLTTVRSPLMTRACPSDPTFSYMMLLKISDVSLSLMEP
jgi:hypothetical protein